MLDQFSVRHRELVSILCTEVFHVGQRKLMTRPKDCQNPRIVCDESNHALFVSILADILFHRVLEDGARAEQ